MNRWVLVAAVRLTEKRVTDGNKDRAGIGTVRCTSPPQSPLVADLLHSAPIHLRVFLIPKERGLWNGR
jgi:hypothetical protein